MSVKVFVLLIAIVCLAAVPSRAAEDAAKISPGIAQVVKLHESGVGADVLLTYVKETPITKPNAEEVLYLTEKGIPKEVIVALLTKRVWTDNPPAQSQAAPAPAPAQQPAQAQTQQQLPPAVATAQPATQSVVYVQQPPVTYAAPYYYPYYGYPYSYYYPYYPSVSVGIGLGYWGGWYGGGHHWHGGGHGHGGGIHVHHR